LNFFDDDTSPAFDRFHITQVFRVNGAFPWYSGGADLRYVSRRLGKLLFRKMHTRSQVFAEWMARVRAEQRWPGGLVELRTEPVGRGGSARKNYQAVKNSG
jgi:hypothetical protein